MQGLSKMSIQNFDFETDKCLTPHIFSLAIYVEHVEIKNLRGGCNLECGKLENGKLESFLVSKNVKMASPKKSNGKLEFSLENGYLENGVGN